MILARIVDPHEAHAHGHELVPFLEDLVGEELGRVHGGVGGVGFEFYDFLGDFISHGVSCLFNMKV